MLDKLIEYNEQISFKQGLYAPWASSCGMCQRAAVLNRLGYHDAQDLPSADAIAKMRDGNLHEADLKQKLRSAGMPIVYEQLPLAISHQGIVITMKLDGLVVIAPEILELARELGISRPELNEPGNYLLECKSTAWDIHPETHVLQVTLYLEALKNIRKYLDINEERWLRARMDWRPDLDLLEGVVKGLLLYKNRTTCSPMLEIVEFDEAILKKALQWYEDVEVFAEKKELPPRVMSVPASFPCVTCRMRTACWDGAVIDIPKLSEELLVDLKRRDELLASAGPQNREVEKINKKLKMLVEMSGHHEAVVGNYWLGVTEANKGGTQYTKLNIKKVEASCKS